MSDEEAAVKEDELEDPQGVQEPPEELSDEEKAKARLKEAVEVQREDLGGLRVKLTVTVPQEIIDERMGEQFAELKREAILPGFRKGHAPLKLVEKRFGSDVGEELKGKLVGGGYLAAIEKQDIKALGDPMIWVKTKEDRIGEDGKPRSVEVDKLVAFDRGLDGIALPKEGPLTFSCELELKPNFELPALEKIPVRKPETVINESDVDAELLRLRTLQGSYKPVDHGAIERNDLLYVDARMTVDGEILLAEENFDLAARDVRIKGVPLIGLGDALVGQLGGKTVELDAVVPQDHENLDLRGKSAHFEFTIREIKRLVPAPMNEAFLSSLNYESEAELRSTFREGLEAESGQIAKNSMFKQIGDHLADQTKVEIPSGLSQREAARVVARRMIEMYQEGVPQSEIDRAADDLHAQAQEQVIHDLKLFFILEKIAEERDIDVTEEELNGAIARIASRYKKRFDRVRDELVKENRISSLYLKLKEAKVFDWLLSNADVTEDEKGPKKKADPKSSRESTRPLKETKKRAAPKTEAKKKPKTVQKPRKKPAVKSKKIK